jgi:hypothetical protein
MSTRVCEFKNTEDCQTVASQFVHTKVTTDGNQLFFCGLDKTEVMTAIGISGIGYYPEMFPSSSRLSALEEYFDEDAVDA